jgi:acyl-CoA synthetase (NDP forming)/GNAT superfamily N-acetyltransferase
MKHVRPLYLPPAYQDAPDHGRLILRDGSTATIRLSKPADIDAVKFFYGHLSPQSRRMRFFCEAKPGEDVLAALCDSTNPQSSMTLLVWRTVDDNPRIIASGSYIADGPTAAEFAVAVDDAFQGKGLGGLLLERLSVLAASHGFTRFNAFTHPGNHHMLETFRHSGFQIREEFQDGMVEVHFSVTPGEASAAHAGQRDRLFTKASLRPFFAPQSIAVIGASRDPTRLGHRLFMTILRQQFHGVVYPVNPQASQVSGVKAYPTAADIPDPVDLAIIAVPRDDVLSVVDQCARRGIRALVILSSGFAESDDTGRALQEQLLARIRNHGMRMLGPNCLGLINTDPEIRLNASMSFIVPERGGIAISSQSGALGMTILRLAQKRKLGISAFVSMGNKADVTGNDLLYYWEDDPATRVIVLYLESFGNPRRFGRIAREVSRRKPILCVKPSRRAQQDDTAITALFHQSGIIRMLNLEEMFDVAALLSTQPLPAGPRFSIITNSRGAGVLCRDAAEAEGLENTSFNDLTADASLDDFALSLQQAMASDTHDAVIAIYMPIGEHDPASFINMLERIPRPKPILLVLTTTEGASAIAHLSSGPIPAYLYPESAARALAAAAHYRTWRDAPPGMIPDFDDANFNAIHELLAHAPDGIADPALTGKILTHAGIITTPVDDVAAEVMIEINQDPVFGPVLSFSLAGYHRDMLNDVAVRMVPLTDLDAAGLIKSIRAFPILHASGAHLETLQEIILRASLLIEEIQEIEHLGLGPVALSRQPGIYHIRQSLIRFSAPA